MAGLEKLAAEFRAATDGMDEEDILLMGAAAETVLLEKEAGITVLSENEVLLISAAVVDNLLGRS